MAFSGRAFRAASPGNHPRPSEATHPHHKQCEELPPQRKLLAFLLPIQFPFLPTRQRTIRAGTPDRFRRVFPQSYSVRPRRFPEGVSRSHTRRESPGPPQAFREATPEEKLPGTEKRIDPFTQRDHPLFAREAKAQQQEAPDGFPEGVSRSHARREPSGASGRVAALMPSTCCPRRRYRRQRSSHPS